MLLIRSMLIAGSFILIAGCTGKELREGVCQGMYDGTRIENRKELSPRERAANPDMDYQQYTIERKERVDQSK